MTKIPAPLKPLSALGCERCDGDHMLTCVLGRGKHEHRFCFACAPSVEGCKAMAAADDADDGLRALPMAEPQPP